MELIKIENGIALLDADVSNKIADFERKIKAIKEAEDELKKTILDEMENKGILKIDTDELIVNYIASTDREIFDSKKFRVDHADLYDDYVKISPVKASVRIKVK